MCVDLSDYTAWGLLFLQSFHLCPWTVVIFNMKEDKAQSQQLCWAANVAEIKLGFID